MEKSLLAMGLDVHDFRGALVTPGHSTMQRYELTLDVACMLLERRRQGLLQSDVCKFSMTDSSPQENRDWVWHQYVEVAHQDLVSLFDDVTFIAQELAEATEDDLGNLMFDTPEHWHAKLKTIRDIPRTHISPPTAVTKGHSGLVHKASALAHSSYVEILDRQGLQKHMQSYRSHTSDMGTELGLPDLNVSCNDLLPPWFFGVDDDDLAVDVEVASNPSRQEGSPDLEVDIEEVDIEVVEAGEGPSPDRTPKPEPPPPPEPDPPDIAGPPPSLDTFMPMALSIAGLQHILDNATKEVAGQMKNFDAFKANLKHWETLLTRRDLVDVYIWSCLKGTPFEDQWISSFQKWQATLYEKRWREIVNFVLELHPLLPCLRRTWSEAKYLACASADGKDISSSKLSLACITSSLRSPFFAKYVLLILQVEKVSKRLSQWAETCICHQKLFAHASSQFRKPHQVNAFRKQCLRRHFGQAFTVCPMAGMLGPELVCGALESHLEDIWQLELLDFMQEEEGLEHLSMEEQEQLAEDLATARAHVGWEIATKLDWCKRLPWKLLGMAHHDQDVARQCAREAYEAFQRDPRQGCHHRITWAWLRPGSPLLAGLQSFIAGTDRSDLDEMFRVHVATSRFVLVSETSIEGKHAKVSMQSMTGIGPVRVSLSNRLPLIEKRVELDDQYLVDLVSCFAEARNFRKIPEIMGFEKHPLIHGVRFTHISELVPVLTQIIYRCSLHDLFDDKTQFSKDHKKKRDRKIRTEQAYVKAEEVRVRGGSDSQNSQKAFAELPCTNMLIKMYTCIHRCIYTLLHKHKYTHAPNQMVQCQPSSQTAS